MTEKVCVGCGSVLQSESPTEPGYVPRSALTREKPLCRRCFRIRHYGEFSRAVVPVEEYERQLHEIAKHPGTVLYILDVFDLAGSMVAGLSKFISGSRVILVVNKVDLLPVEVNYINLTSWIEDTVQSTGVVADEVVFVSAKSDVGVDIVIDEIERQAADTCYVVGMANVGKSSILNRLLQHLISAEQPLFTVSKVPGTTLGLTGTDVPLPNGNSVRLVDTPGLIRENRLSDSLCADCLRVVVPSSRLRPRVFQLNPGQSLFFGNAARLDFVDGVRQSMVCYVSNDLVVHRTKLSNAENFRKEHQDDILAAPCATCREVVGPLQIYPVSTRPVTPAGKQFGLKISRQGADITLPGLGWVSFSGKPLAANFWLPSCVKPGLRPRLIGELSRQH